MSQTINEYDETADENITSTVGVFQCCILLSCSFFCYICIAFYTHFCHYFVWTTKYIKLLCTGDCILYNMCL